MKGHAKVRTWERADTPATGVLDSPWVRPPGLRAHRGRRQVEHDGIHVRMSPNPSMKQAVLLVAMLFPTLATWLYFVAFAGHPAMRVVFALGKLAQFALPLVWIVGVERRPPRFFAGGTRGAGTGLVLGAIIGGGVLAAHTLAVRSGLLAGAPEAIRAKVVEIGAVGPLEFLALALFYSALHFLIGGY